METFPYLLYLVISNGARVRCLPRPASGPRDCSLRWVRLEIYTQQNAPV